MWVVHYAEIGLKGKNRGMFERQLVENIRAVVRGTVKRVSGRVLVETKDRKVGEKLSRVFGVANFSQTVSCRAEEKAITRTAVKSLEGKKGTFRVSARRDYKKFSLTSMELNQKVGAEIASKLGLKVKLDKPDSTVFIEVLRDQALVYTEVFQGPGGLPIGVSGKVVCLLSGGIDSPAAGWMMMKRGCEVVFVHFWNEAMGGKSKMGEMIRELRKWQPGARMVTMPFRAIQNQVIAQVPADWRIIVYRRIMLKIAERVAGKAGAKALVTGDSLAQVASQTLDNIVVTEDAVTMPVFRPLIGMDKQEIINLAEKIGTYNVSVKPYQDCCTFMVPKHPVTRARMQDLERAESGLDMEGLVNKILPPVKPD